MVTNDKAAARRLLICFVVVLMTAVFGFMYRTWISNYVIGCARILPYGWATDYRVSWEVCHYVSDKDDPSCGGLSYVVPESSPERTKATISNYKPSPDGDNCMEYFQDGTLVKMCGGSFKITKLKQDVAKSGYNSGWFPITCALTPEQEFPEPDMDAVWREIHAKCDAEKAERNSDCDCENKPLECLDNFSSSLS